MPASKSSGSSRPSNVLPLLAAIAVAAAAGAGVAWWCFAHGYTLYYGDAEAHLNIARRILDSRTPGPRQIGTVWLPLPHVLLAPFAAVDSWWRSGFAGIVPSVAAFAAAAGFLFAAVRRTFQSDAAAFAAAAVFVLNPNMLYLQSAPMTEPWFALWLAAWLWATLWFRQSQSVAAILTAAAASAAASLTRYEGWFLIPLAAAYLWWIARDKRHAVLFAALAALAPLAWLAHNQFYWGNPFEFYNGPYSAMAIYQRQLAGGMMPHPGAADWLAAARYYLEAMRLVLGTPLIALSGVGVLAALWRRAWWPGLFLALPAAFYTWSIHSGGTPVFVPDLPPFSRYNTRYALAMLPCAALLAGALVAVLPRRTRPFAAAAIPIAIAAIWLGSAAPLSACWAEAEAGSLARREWSRQAAAYLASEYQPTSGVLFNFGDLAGVFRRAAIPLRETLYQDNGRAWEAALADPDQAPSDWALAMEGDPVSQALSQSTSFALRRRIIVEGAPVVAIYHRQ
jgi:hypothetical protein